MINFTSFGLGTSNLASLGRSITKNEATYLFSTALEKGVRTIDTANTYGSGDSERLIARAISGNRNEFFIITKAGFPYFNSPGFLSPLNQIGKKIIQKTNPNKNYSKKYLIKSLYDSLKRLNVNQVDAFLLHEPSKYDILKYPDCWAALMHIKKSGMAKYVGVSTDDIDVVKEAIFNNVIDLAQTSMPYSNSNNDTVLIKCMSENVPVIVNRVLRITNDLRNDQFIIDGLKSIGRDNDIIPLIIGYVLFSRDVSCVLIGTKNVKHLIANIITQNEASEMSFMYNYISSLYT